MTNLFQKIELSVHKGGEDANSTSDVQVIYCTWCRWGLG